MKSGSFQLSLLIFSAHLIILLIVFAFLVPVNNSAFASTGTLGNTSIGSTTDSGDSNDMNGSQFTTGASSEPVTSMSVYVTTINNSPNNQYQLAIYTDNNGKPGTLVTNSSSGTLTANAWNTLSISATLNPNTNYWLMYNTNGTSPSSNNMKYSSGGLEGYSSNQVAFGTWPSSFGASTTGAGTFSIYATYTTSSGSTGTFGNTSIGSTTDSGNSNDLSATQFTTGSSSEAVTSMSVYVATINNSPNNQYQLAIYTDNNGIPGTLLANSSTGTLTANSWNTVSVNATLSPNTNYWLVYNANGTNSTYDDIPYNTGGLGAYSKNQVAFGTWPSSFGTAVTGAWIYSIYATYTTTSNGPPAATPTPTPGPNGGNIVNLNFGITNEAPWIQSTCGDIRNDNGIIDKLPGGSYGLVSGTECANPGIAFTGNLNANFGSGQASTTNQVVGGATYPELFDSSISTNYSSLLSKAQTAGITPTNLSTICSLSNCTLPATLPHGIYLASGNLTLSPTAYTFPAKSNFVILVNGNLTIQGNISVPVGSTALFSTTGNITVASTVGTATPTSTTSDLDGWYIAGQSFIVNSAGGCNDLRLNIAGSVVVDALGNGGSFQNNRDLCGADNADPTVSFAQRLDMILNAPQFIESQTTQSHEVSP